MKLKKADLSFSKPVYEKPIVEIIELSSMDIVSTSGPSGPTDDNQGEWDAQKYMRYPNY